MGKAEFEEVEMKAGAAQVQGPEAVFDICVCSRQAE
jgi:hypothetical protein